MSFFPGKDPVAGDAHACDAIDLVIVPRSVDLGGFNIRRALPHVNRRMVGPFIFFDHFGPAEFRTGEGLDVRPHPHIGLATVSFLFDGEIVHKDTLGSDISIKPGAVNLMSAGRGIAHSERSPADRNGPNRPIHGLQLWVALPRAGEEGAPAFIHHDPDALPVVNGEGKSVRVIAGNMLGARSPLKTEWDTIFADVTLTPGASFPLDADYKERAIYIVGGEVEIAGDRFAKGRLLVFKPGDRITVKATGNARFVVVGGAAMDGPRHIWWNFVSSRKERIDQAKADWKAGHFGKVPGDEIEFIPLPE